jgi:hypothetical protein
LYLAQAAATRSVAVAKLLTPEPAHPYAASVAVLACYNESCYRSFDDMRRSVGESPRR